MSGHGPHSQPDTNRELHSEARCHISAILQAIGG
jgi:hypothetical protein